MKQLVILAVFCLALALGKRVKLTNVHAARRGEYPYQVSLQLDGTHSCGGSLISKKHVLTAGHCVYDIIVNKIDKSRLKVVVGSTTLTGGTEISVDRIACYGLYDPSTLEHDIAVIRLKKEITESETVKPIGLPKKGQQYVAGEQMIISGFGADQLNGPVSQYLKKMYMYTVGKVICQQYWPTITLGPGQICAALAPGYGICQGDSGGPLTIDKKIVVGVVSAVSGAGCGVGYPDLFTKVSYYMDFIESELALTG